MIVPGPVQAGDRITVIDRPPHDVTVGLAFRAFTTQPELLPRLLDADALPEAEKALARRRTAIVLDTDVR